MTAVLAIHQNKGAFFGYMKKVKITKHKTIKLRMVRYLISCPEKMKNFGDLAITGPDDDCVISEEIEMSVITGIVSLLAVSPEAEAKWIAEADIEIEEVHE